MEWGRRNNCFLPPLNRRQRYVNFFILSCKCFSLWIIPGVENRLNISQFFPALQLEGRTQHAFCEKWNANLGDRDTKCISFFILAFSGSSCHALHLRCKNSLHCSPQSPVPKKQSALAFQGAAEASQGSSWILAKKFATLQNVEDGTLMGCHAMLVGQESRQLEMLGNHGHRLQNHY